MNLGQEGSNNAVQQPVPTTCVPVAGAGAKLLPIGLDRELTSWFGPLTKKQAQLNWDNRQLELAIGAVNKRIEKAVSLGSA
eukprot:NODE_4394_length_473_cov_173.990566_g3778_i0.p1 GENE.NODE_4394_length_473_cov_173.990566_g3778_i0~~NODE_4394_length_473_cov_173.990566_g3778_i0.p1  ORF type:complete len:81 (-),score=15.83 NODE_4394_length_473_cov_173.990566_g3778_i0:158-400(-)